MYKSNTSSTTHPIPRLHNEILSFHGYTPSPPHTLHVGAADTTTGEILPDAMIEGYLDHELDMALALHFASTTHTSEGHQTSQQKH